MGKLPFADLIRRINGISTPIGDVSYDATPSANGVRVPSRGTLPAGGTYVLP
jgi:hypothetical protein